MLPHNSIMLTGLWARLRKSFSVPTLLLAAAGIALAAAVFPCRIAVALDVGAPPSASGAASRPLINDGRLCIEEQCLPAVLVLAALPGDLREQLDARIAKAAGKPLWVCFLSAGGEAKNNTTMAPFPENVSTCVVPVMFPNGKTADGVCASACAWAWMAGRRREIFEGGASGFHGAWVGDSCWCTPTNYLTARWHFFREELADRDRYSGRHLEVRNMLRSTALGYGPDDAYQVDAGRAKALGLQGAQRRAIFHIDRWTPAEGTSSG